MSCYHQAVQRVRTPFRGTISFDGINQALAGPACLWVGTLGDADDDTDRGPA